MVVYLNFRFTQMNDGFRKHSMHSHELETHDIACHVERCFLFVSLLFSFFRFLGFVFFFLSTNRSSSSDLTLTSPSPKKKIESKQALALKVELSLHCQVVLLMRLQDRLNFYLGHNLQLASFSEFAFISFARLPKNLLPLGWWWCACHYYTWGCFQDLKISWCI